MIIDAIAQQLGGLVSWGLVATVVMTTILYGSQGAGLSRLSLPFLMGTFFTGDRYKAGILGFLLYVLGGWVFAFFYFVLFALLGYASWWLGAIFGAVHAAFLLAVVLPLLPSVHPRMATEYDGPTAVRRLEPPGFMGLNYGQRTPLTTLIGMLAYGIILGALYQVPGSA